MKHFYFLLALLFSASTLYAGDWSEIKGDHFIVFYKADEAFAREVGRHAESYYTQIANDLGYARYSNFWQWENRVKIYIHLNQADFRKATGEKEWSAGMASYSKKEIHTFANSEGFLDGILPHEITHLIFRDFVGMQGYIPLWLDEGVAQYEEPAKRQLAKKYARYLIKIDKEYPIQDLIATDIRKSNDQEKVDAFYMQSVSLVDFLVTSYGANAFTIFCRELRDGKKFEVALHSAYPNYIEDLIDFEKKWRKYVVGEAPPEELEIYSKGGV